MFQGRQQARLNLTRHPMNGKPASFASALVLCLVLSTSLHAATIPVNTTRDGFVNDGLCGLREAIEAANRDEALWGCPAGQGADLIELGPGDFVLGVEGAREDDNQTGDLDLQGEAEIVGAGMDVTRIDGSGLDRVFDLHGPGSWVIQRVTVKGGVAPPATVASPVGEDGGGIRLRQGALTLRGCRLADNQAGFGPQIRTEQGYDFLTQGGSGGGIFAGGGAALDLEDCRVERNSAGGTEFVELSSGTSAPGHGHGIHALGVSLRILRSTIADNGPVEGHSFESNGGGIYCTCPLVMEDSIVERNRSGDLAVFGQEYSPWYWLGGDGGGIYATDRVLIRRSSFVDNTAGTCRGERCGGSRGGALFATGEVLVEDSSWVRNSAGVFDERRGYRGGRGGAIHAEGPLTLRRVALIRNQAGPGPAGNIEHGEATGPGGDGGGVYAAGSLLVEQSFVIENRAGTGGEAQNTIGDDNDLYGLPGGDGGGIMALGNAMISQTLLMDNEAGTGPGGDYYRPPVEGAGGHGGGLAIQGRATVNRCTFWRNRGGLGEPGGFWPDQHHQAGVGGHGGAIYVSRRGMLTLIGSTLSGNVTGESDAEVGWWVERPADGNGGGIFNKGHSTLIDSTVAFNRTGSDARHPGAGLAGMGTWSLVNTLVAHNEALRDADAMIFGAGFASRGHNLMGDIELFGPGVLDSTDVQGVEARLSPLGLTGGVLPTHGLEPGSPALDGGAAGCAVVDGRGVARPQGGACDIGAVEMAPQSNVARWDRWEGAKDAPLRVEAPGVVSNDTLDGNSTLRVLQGPFNGAVEVAQDGGLVYTPRAGFHGLDLFVYGVGASVEDVGTRALVQLEVLPLEGRALSPVASLNLTPFEQLDGPGAVTDNDGGGMRDDCEDVHGFNPFNPEDDWLDSDRDGPSNADECNVGTDPTLAGSLTGLKALSPEDGAELAEGEALRLVVRNGVANDDLPVTYRFAVWGNGVDGVQSPLLPAGRQGVTSWLAPVSFRRGTTFFWNVTATHPHIQVKTPGNRITIVPSTPPNPLRPFGAISTLEPLLVAYAGQGYTARVGDLHLAFELLMEGTVVIEGRVPWQEYKELVWPPGVLEPEHTYRWRVAVVDDTGPVGVWSNVLEFTTPKFEAIPERDPLLNAFVARSPRSGARLRVGSPLALVVGHDQIDEAQSFELSFELFKVDATGRLLLLWHIEGIEPGPEGQTQVAVPDLPPRTAGDFAWRAIARRNPLDQSPVFTDTIPFSIEVASDPAPGGCHSIPGRPGSAPSTPGLWGLMALLTLGARLSGARRRAATPARR